MSTRNKQQKPKKSQTSQVIRAQAQGPLSNVGSNVLPGAASVTERIQHIRQTSFNGPIPHPEIFRLYGEVIPDAPERILRVFEEDSKHARDIAQAALTAQKEDNRRVHWMAWSLIAGGYALGFALAMLDKDILAGAVFTTTLTGTIVGFLQGRQEEKKPEEK